MKLQITPSCEIFNLIKCVAEKTGKTFDECEKASFREGLFPEGTKTFVSLNINQNDDWFRKTVCQVMQECGIDQMYITYPI